MPPSLEPTVKKSTRRLWFAVHGWLSLPVWLLFSVICITGTLAVISHELTWLTNPAARASNPDNLPRQPLPVLLAAVEKAVPDGEIGHVLVMEPYLITAVSLSSPSLPQAIAYVNPYTAEVQEINPGLTFIGLIRALHGWLLFPWEHSYSIGYYLVSAMCVVVLGAMITGMVVYKRFWQAYRHPVLRWRAGSRVLLGDLHRLAGAWSLWFLLVMGITGAWYLTQAILWHNEIAVEAEIEPLADADVPLSISARQVPLTQALAAAEAALPGLEVSMLSLPEHSRDTVTLMGSQGEILFDPYSNRVRVNPWSGEVVEVHTPADMGPLEVVAHIADPLHYGTLGGLWTKAIWFVFGALLSGMSITGFLIWSKRTVAALREEDTTSSAPTTLPALESSHP